MPTLKDVAERSGVTVTTVSRVLNNRGYISDQTRKKVYDAMKELNYQPNELARSLIKKRTNSIGIIVPSIAHPFFAKVAAELERVAAKNGFKIMLCNSNHQREKEIEYIDMLRSNQVSGIVICSRTKDIEESLDLGLPVVTFERSLSSSIPGVSCDNFQGGELATRRLIQAGCKRLIHISGSVDVHMPADQRCDAFRKVCSEAGIYSRVYGTEEEQFQSLDYHERVEKILCENPGVDGVFASSDVIAAHVIHGCAKLGIRIPGDLKLIGFDDVAIAELTTPTLTTIRQPVKQMCEYAIGNIIKQLSGKLAPVQTVLPVSLVERESTKEG